MTLHLSSLFTVKSCKIKYFGHKRCVLYVQYEHISYLSPYPYYVNAKCNVVLVLVSKKQM